MIIDYLMIALVMFAGLQALQRLWMLSPFEHKLWYGVIYAAIIVGAVTTLFRPKEGATVLLFAISVSLAMSRKSWLHEPPEAAKK